MNAFRYIVASLKHYRRVHLAVALGVAVATAVLTGALSVGDSVRGSLRDLTLQRLGRIDSALVTGHLFREALADELAADAQVQSHFSAAEPAILTGGTLQAGSGSDQRRATSISIVGCRTEFWSLGQGGPATPLADDEIAITEALARELDVAAGGDVLLRIPTFGPIPSDSPLGEKSDTSLARRLRVAAVLPPNGLARFGLVPSQHLPRNVFIPLATLQQLLDKPGKANAILVATDHPLHPADTAAQEELARAFRPHLEDFGVRVESVPAPADCLQISADELVLPNEIVCAAKKAFGANQLQPVVTYLANTIAAGEGELQRKIPYSTVTGVDSTAALGPLLDDNGAPIVLGEDEIALNRWAAEDLKVEVGEAITVTYYEPESTHGQLREHQPPPVFKLRAIVELESADGKPTLAADPKLTPELPGVTDQESIDDWELPFELTEKIRPQDEEYWDAHRTTPKAFVSLATAKRLWPSRWGTISLLRLPAVADGAAASAAVESANQLAKAIKPAALGMAFLPVKQQGLAASSGTTPFDALFLGFSFFLIAAAVMLIALLFQLGIQQRAAELGTLAAVGMEKRRMTRLLSREGLIVAAIGAVIGVACGVLYAWAMIIGLTTWWVAAIATPFLELHVTWRSLILGGIAGLATSWLTIRWCISRLVRQPAARLLSGSTAGELRPSTSGQPRRKLWPIVRVLLILALVPLVYVGWNLTGEAQAGAFFGSGAAVLLLLLGEVRHRLRHARTSSSAPRVFSLTRLSAMNTARNPTRSTLTIGLVAAATFLIVAVSAFHLDTGEEGTGGFDLIATSDLPIHYDLNTPEGRQELGFSDSASKQMENWRFYALRAFGGEDASCLNLYRPTQPRVLGVPESFISRSCFPMVDSLEQRKGTGWQFVNDWNALRADRGQDADGRSVVPVFLDANTAAYSLHLGGVGSRFTIRDGANQPVTLEVAGLLKNSVLQGKLMMSETHFLRLFPEVGGYQFFCIEYFPPPNYEIPKQSIEEQYAERNPDKISQLLESNLADFGFDAVDPLEQLAAFTAVQNTYLSTFQSLGALGLLLGTAGLAAVQLRSVLERRGELRALMRAGGFPRARLMRMVVLENAALLLGGLAVGCAAAIVALIPQWLPRDAAIPWLGMALLLATIAVVGLTVGWLATRSALRAPILPALRGD